MAADEENKATTSTTARTGTTANKSAESTAVKKPATLGTAASKAAATSPSKSAPAKKSTPAKGVDVERTESAYPSAPLKAGATRAASTTDTDGTNRGLKARAMKTVRSAANEGRSLAGEAIGGLSEMIEGSARSIDGNLGEKYGNYARSAADSMSSFADKINSKDVDEMVEEAREFVRKKPAIAIGAAAVVGLLVSRLIKSGMKDKE